MNHEFVVDLNHSVIPKCKFKLSTNIGTEIEAEAEANPNVIYTLRSQTFLRNQGGY